jgi:hypothetical protein
MINPKLDLIDEICFRIKRAHLICAYRHLLPGLFAFCFLISHNPVTCFRNIKF